MILMIFLKGTHQWRKTDVKYGLWKSGRKCRSKYSLYQNILQEKPRKKSQHGKKHGLLRWGGQGLVVVPLEWQFCHEVPQQPRHRHLREEQHLGGAMEGLTMRMIFARRNLKSIITDLPHLDDGFDAFFVQHFGLPWNFQTSEWVHPSGISSFRIIAAEFGKNG